MRLIQQYIFTLFLLFICLFPAPLTVAAQENVDVEVNDDDDGEGADEASLEILTDSCQTDSIPMTWQERIRYDAAGILEKEYTIKKTTTVRKKGRRRRTVRLRKPIIIKRQFTPACIIYDLTTDSVLYELDTERMMTPASTQKLFVTAAMLTKHGANFNYETFLYTHGTTATDSTGRRFLDGDIVVEARCNPVLGEKDLGMMKEAVMRLGVDSISGSVILKEDARVLRKKTAELRVAKELAERLKADSVAFATKNPWKMETVERDSLNRLARFSTPLSEVLPAVLKNSNNGYAESMLLNLIKESDNWTYDDCRKVVSDLTEKIRKKYSGLGNKDYGLYASTPYYNIADGSGLSHQNKTTAKAQMDLLRYIYAVPSIFRPIYDCLPIAGVDGTIGKRMKKGTAYDNVRAKTGTVNAVSTLSGYAKASNGHFLAFTILINNCSDLAFARSLQDKVCEAMTR